MSKRSLLSLTLLSLTLSLRAQTPTFLLDLTNEAVLAGRNIAFSVSVSGPGPLTYQWQVNGRNLASNVVTTVAGSGSVGRTSNGIPALSAPLENPLGIAVAAAGNLYVSSTEGNQVCEVGTNGILTVIAGDPPQLPMGDGDGGPSSNAVVEFPQGLTLDSAGNLLIAEQLGRRIREISTNGIIETVTNDASPTDVAVDASGDLFVADSVNNVVWEFETNGTRVTVAAHPALKTPTGLALDGEGNLFIADYGNNVIRRLGTNGVVTIVAGKGTAGFAGDGGAATNAELNQPAGVAVDAFGDLFIADFSNNRIRKVGTDGIIRTIVGMNSHGFVGDGGPAIITELNNPAAVKLDSSGNLFIADSANNRIRKVTYPGPSLLITNASSANAGSYDVVVSSPSGSVTSKVVTLTLLYPPAITTVPQSATVAVGSSATLNVTATGTPPLNYEWNFDGVALTGQTNTALTLSDAQLTNSGSYDVVVASPYGAVTSAPAVVIVGYPPSIVTGPSNLTELAGGDVGFSVTATGTGPLNYLWQFNGAALSNEISTVAGGGGADLFDGLVATNAELSWPEGVVVDASGNIFIADTYANAVCKVTPDGIIHVVAGTLGQNGSYSGDGGLATAATLNKPTSLVVDAVGNLFISDWMNFRIREVATNGIITTVAGNGYAGFSGDGGPATNAELDTAYVTHSGPPGSPPVNEYNPMGLGLDAAGNLFIADSDNNRIRKVGTNGIITTVAGDGSFGYAGDGGLATNASLSWPYGVTVNNAGELFIADLENSVIRKVATNGVITTVAGNGTFNVLGDGTAAITASLYDPSDVVVDASGNLFIGSDDDNRVREVGTNGIIFTVAGTTPTGGFLGDGGLATNAELNSPIAVALDGAGNLFIADTYNNRIRKVTFPKPALQFAPVNAGDAGSYDLVVSDAFGSVTSSIVTLAVASNLLGVSEEGAQANLQFQGLPGQNYVLMSAPNLTPPVRWTPIVTNAADTNGAWSFVVPNVASNQASFYRISAAGK